MSWMFWDSIKMWLEIENQRYCFNLVNKSPKVDISNREKSLIDFFALARKGLMQV